MSKCKCYHTQNKLKYTYDQITGSPIPHDVEVGVCWGTKECDECRCEGDESKCDFYPEVRAKADKTQEMANVTRLWCEIDNTCGSCHWETCNECLAECLYKAGYRKASDVAREILEKIGNALYDMATEYADTGHYAYYAVCEMVHHKVIRPIEKKYESEDNK